MAPILECAAHVAGNDKRVLAGVTFIGSPGLTGRGINRCEAVLGAGWVRRLPSVRLIALWRLSSFVHHGVSSRLIPTRVKANSFRGFQSRAIQTLWSRTGGLPCGQGLRFAPAMT